MDDQTLVRGHRCELYVILKTARAFGHHDRLGLEIADLFGPMIVYVNEKHQVIMSIFRQRCGLTRRQARLCDLLHEVIKRMHRVGVIS